MKVGDTFIDADTGIPCEVVWTSDMPLVAQGIRLWRAGSSIGLAAHDRRAPRDSQPGSRGSFGRNREPWRAA